MRIRKAYIALSIILTLSFIALGLTIFWDSFPRLIEAFRDLVFSIKYYFCELFMLDNGSDTPVNDFSGTIEFLPQLPSTSDVFWERVKLFFLLFINKKNLLMNYNGFISWLATFLRIVVILAPVFVIFYFIFKKVYHRPNTNHGKDTIPLRIWKAVSKYTYQPLRSFILGYGAFLTEKGYWWKIWLAIWILNFNLGAIIVEFFAFYFYFAMSFDFLDIYKQVCKLVIDLQVILTKMPIIGWIVIGWGIFSLVRLSIAKRVVRHYEAIDCGVIKSLPIATMGCAPMGMKKTTMITDMALSQAVMFRQEAFARLQKQDMKFPFFPWILFEDEIQRCMEYGVIYNLVSIKEWIALKRQRFEKHGRDDLQLYGYDSKKYGLWYDDCLKPKNIFDVLETYAKLYFIYVIETSLLVGNYSIREDDILCSEGNFPVWSSTFFPENYRESRFAHILDFDILRLGKKVIEDNKNAGSFEFGVIFITEVGKERGNNLELQEIKKKTDETNQKNDLFNAWLKMCRHSATVDNFPFIKVFVDEQRPESWGADARDLTDVLTIIGSGDQRIAMPFYTIEEMISDWIFGKFMDIYYDLRYCRGDNTLLVYAMKNITNKIYQRNIRLYNRFGYCTVQTQRERGTMNGKKKIVRYYLMNKKIYSDRFTTDCFSDYFNDLASQTNVGLMDYISYATSKATVEELKLQNSYFIRSLYGV